MTAITRRPVLAAAVLTAAAVLVLQAVNVASPGWPAWWLLAAQTLPALIVWRLAAAVIRFALADRASRRNYPQMIRARFHWHWLARNLGLAYNDVHRKRRIRDYFLRVPGGAVEIGRGNKVLYPRARFTADAFGIVARVKTVPRSGRREFDLSAQHIADAWRVQRVQVAQERPGRLLVRGLVTDPLTLPLAMSDAPAGTYGEARDWSLYLGRDEWGKDRSVPLSGVTGIAVAGLPGFGKTTFINSVLCQYAGTPAAQFVLVDGKGGGDYSDWRERCWLMCGDTLPDALDVLEDVHAEMRRRLLAIENDRALPRNSWAAGPTEAMPLLITIVDEVQTFMDLDAFRGDRQLEPIARRIRSLVGQLVRKGRAVLLLTIVATQKATSDAIPTFVRDNTRCGLSFGVRTMDAAVAGLGESIRDYPSYSPVGLRDSVYVGVATATLPNGADPFTRVRIPEVTEEAAAARALATCQFRRDPSARAPELVAS